MANHSGTLAFAVLLIIIGIIMIVTGAVMFDSTGRTAGTTTGSSNWTWWLIVGGIFLFIIGIILAFWSYRGSSKEGTVMTETHVYEPPQVDAYGHPIVHAPYGQPYGAYPSQSMTNTSLSAY